MSDEKKPWEAKIFNTGNEESPSRRLKKGAIISTPFLTLLMSIFFIILLLILFIMYYTANGGGDAQEDTSNFYGATTQSSDSKKSSKKDDEIKEETTSQEESTETTEETTVAETTTAVQHVTGATIVVEAGEGPSSIAARAGISLERLYALNPDKMVGPGGTWWANPGDVVYID